MDPHKKHRAWKIWTLCGVFYVLGVSWDGATGHGGAWFVRLALLGLCLSLSHVRPGTGHTLQVLFFPLLFFLFMLWGAVEIAHTGLALQLYSRLLFCLAFYMLLQALGGSVYVGLCRFFLGCACFYSSWALFEFIITKKDRCSAGFFNANHLAAFLLPCSLILLIYSARGDKRRDARVNWPVLLCILCTAGILATQSRMGLIVLFLCGLSVLLSLGGRASRKPIMLGLVFTFIVGAYALMPRFIGENDPNAYSRIAIWQSTLEIASQNPFGVGLGGGADALRIHGVGHGDLVRYAHVAKHSHSEFLNLILECGWPGLILLLLGLGYVALMHFQLARDSKTITKDMASELRILIESPWSAVAITLSFLLPALTSNTWHVPPVAYLMVFWFSFLHDTYTKTHVKRPVVISSMLWVFMTRILVVCAFAFVSTQALGSYALRYSGKAQEQGDLEKARAYAHLAAALGPWNIGPQLMHVALDYNMSGSVEDALKSLEDLTQRFSKSPEPLKRALFVLKNTHGIEKKKKSMMMLKLREELAKREPKNALLWLKAGESAESVDDFVVAENFFRRALEVEPHCARALAYVATYEKKVGNIEDTHKYVKLAWRSDDLAKNYKGYALDVLSLDQRARQHLLSLKVER